MSANVYVVFPTCNVPRAEACAQRWWERGYGVGLLVNTGWGSTAHSRWLYPRGNHWPTGWQSSEADAPYDGYYASQNTLARLAVEWFEADAVVCAGDDMDPDDKHLPVEILESARCRYPDGLWVLQPCGDDAGKDRAGTPAAARICGSPWLSPAYIRRGYGGAGPYPAAPLAPYKHLFGDEELWHVAKLLEILWLRPDLRQEHLHYSFGKSAKQPYASTISSYWEHDKAIFEKRRAEGFPGHGLGAAQ